MASLGGNRVNLFCGCGGRNLLSRPENHCQLLLRRLLAEPFHRRVTHCRHRQFQQLVPRARRSPLADSWPRSVQAGPFNVGEADAQDVLLQPAKAGRLITLGIRRSFCGCKTDTTESYSRIISRVAALGPLARTDALCRCSGRRRSAVEWKGREVAAGATVRGELGWLAAGGASRSLSADRGCRARGGGASFLAGGQRLRSQ